MTSTAPDPTDRAAALRLLEPFAARILPGTVRRIAAWKRIPRAELPDLTGELRQELALDCLQHPQTILQLPTPQRHLRWMRHAERWIYHHRGAGRRPTTTLRSLPEPTVPQKGRGMPGELPSLPAEATVALANGRCNLTASAARTGTKLRAMRKQIEVLASELGCDDDYLAFWRRRLGEALTGLAADLLRDRGHVRLLRRERNPPDPGSRLRRIRRIGARFHVRRSTIAVRRLLGPWVRRPRLDETAPRRLLEQATSLCPAHADAWFWLFEACVAESDLPGAALAIRSCRGRVPPRDAAITLARARLLEARGRWPAALALLQRARRRQPHEARLRQALAESGCEGGQSS